MQARIFPQIIKFVAVGLINTSVDFVVLNILIFLFGTGAHGEYFVLFKGISFVVAVTNSFVFNKYWVFEQRKSIGAKNVSLFFIISTIGFFINLAVSYLIYSNAVAVQHLSPHLSANIGALVGSLAVMMWNFSGYKLIVFKK